MFSPSRLQQVMRVQGRQVNWIAEQTDYAPSQVSRILNGSVPMTEKFARRAARALGVPVEWLADTHAAFSHEAVPA